MRNGSCKYGSNCRFNHPDPTVQQPMAADEYPERPGQPDCSYFLKTGGCKYRSNCKFNHPKVRITKSPSCVLSDKGLPLRPVS
ncbi:Zinc finger CCCH domain-containing protein 63 [Linum perenne]